MNSQRKQVRFPMFYLLHTQNPIVLPLPCTELYYEYDEDIDYLVLYSTYNTEKGLIIAYQVWDIEEMVSTTSTEYETYDIDRSIYYSIEEDGTIVVIKVLDESVLYLESKGTYSVDELAKLITSDKT